MSTEAIVPAELAALVGTTAHVAIGTRYASYNVTAVVPHETEPGWWHLRAGRLQSPAIQPDSVHATEADARAAIRVDGRHPSEVAVTVDEARVAGRDAYRAGAPRVPPRSLFVDGPVGSTDLAVPRAWLAGWDTANLAEPV